VTAAEQVLRHVHRSLLDIARLIHVNQVHVVFHVPHSIQVNVHQINMDKQLVHVLVLLQQQQRQQLVLLPDIG
jgi:hypothetical protein